MQWFWYELYVVILVWTLLIELVSTLCSNFVSTLCSNFVSTLGSKFVSTLGSNFLSTLCSNFGMNSEKYFLHQTEDIFDYWKSVKLSQSFWNN